MGYLHRVYISKIVDPCWLKASELRIELVPMTLCLVNVWNLWSRNWILSWIVNVRAPVYCFLWVCGFGLDWMSVLVCVLDVLHRFLVFRLVLFLVCRFVVVEIRFSVLACPIV